ncbi:polyketide synthase, partial [Methylogaea oryzae]
MNGAVKLTQPLPGVACLQMEDRAGGNTFTQALVCGLVDGLRQAQQDPATRVIVLHGYDSLFCAGGTLEELVDIADGRRSFDEGAFYRLLLDCPLPVIAAMQGHAMGGGLVFGLYADLLVLSRESLYGANFMKYGFTPGMGATDLLPRKLGPLLAAEMLFSARSYH